MHSAEHHSGQEFKEAVSTPATPYHYVGAGLPNVYLVGVKYRVTADGQQSADIPCLQFLLESLSKALLEKKAALTADEIRFLRKRLRIPSKDFAAYVGKTAETYSRLENGAPVSIGTDRLIRLVYAALAKLPEASEGLARTTWTASLHADERILAFQDENHHWVVQTQVA